MRHFFFIAATLLAFSCKNQNEEAVFSSWKTYPTPSQSLAQQYNSEPEDWIVYKVGDSLKVTLDRGDIDKYLPFKIDTTWFGEISFIATDDGYLVGLFAGEFGGSLHWISKDGQSSYQIGEYQLVGFTKTQNRIYAIEGLNHLTMSDGSMLELVKINGRWSVKTFLELGEAPLGIDTDRRANIIVMTSDKLLSIDKNKHIDTLVSGSFWNYSLYPTSIVIKNDIVYCGMRKGVYKYHLSNAKEEWLMK